MSDKLGFTFYPKDWWTSESYFELNPIQRYYYLECLFIMYSNDGYMKTQKTQFENRIRTEVLQSDWEIVISKFILENDLYTHISVNKRLRKAVANRENGKLGGRPSKPKKPNSETQKNPPLESEREIEDKKKIETENNNVSFLTELLNSQSWLESLAMNNQKKFTLIQVKEKLKIFATELDLKFDIKQNKNEFSSHFVSWLNKQENTKVKPYFNSPA